MTKTCLLVVGMHRTGTSAAASVLGMLGAALPKQMIGAAPTNPKGHFEPERLVALHDRLLASAGFAYDRWDPLPDGFFDTAAARALRAEAVAILEEEYGDAPLLVLKDPRLCRLLPFIRGALEDFGAEIRVVTPLRDPVEVVRSLGQRDGFPAIKSYLLWQRYTLDGERHSRDLRRVFIRYDELLRDWRPVVGRILRILGLDLPCGDDTARAIDALLDRDLRHHRAEDSPSGAEVPAWVTRTVAACQDLVADPAAPAALAALDALGRDFDAETRLLDEAWRAQLERVQSLAEQQRQAIEDLVAERNDQLEVTRGLLTERGDQLEATRGLLSERGEQLQATRDLLTLRGEQLEVTRGLLTERGEQLQAAQGLLAERDQALRAAEERLAREQADLAALRRHAGLLEEQLDRSRQKTVTLETELQNVYASRSWRLTEPVRRILRHGQRKDERHRSDR